MKSEKIVHTADIEGVTKPLAYARTPEGKIDFQAYKSLDAVIYENGLSFAVKIVDARRRYGHLDLQVTPVKGAGTRWVERKNIVIPNDPAILQKNRKSIIAKRGRAAAKA